MIEELRNTAVKVENEQQARCVVALYELSGFEDETHKYPNDGLFDGIVLGIYHGSLGWWDAGEMKVITLDQLAWDYGLATNDTDTLVFNKELNAVEFIMLDTENRNYIISTVDKVYSKLAWLVSSTRPQVKQGSTGLIKLKSLNTPTSGFYLTSECWNIPEPSGTVELLCNHKEGLQKATLDNGKVYIREVDFTNGIYGIWYIEFNTNNPTHEETKPQWNGEYLPPVGAECFMEMEHEPTQKVKLKYIDNDVVFYNLIETPHIHSFAPVALVKFRPLKTEREKLRERLLDIIASVGQMSNGVLADALIDAGARFND